MFAANLNSLHSRRHDLSKSFFQDICDLFPAFLLPPQRDTSVLSRLRTVTPLPRLTSRAKNIAPSLYTHKSLPNKSTQLTQDSILHT